MENTPTGVVLEAESLSPKLAYRNPEAVKEYLALYPEIENFINAAWPALIKHFDGPVEIALEVLTYPDEVIYKELVAWIQSTDDIQEGLAKLSRFEDEWFLDHMAEVGNKFNFNLETK